MKLREMEVREYESESEGGRELVKRMKCENVKAKRGGGLEK
jgi:hypothetical protein